MRQSKHLLASRYEVVGPVSGLPTLRCYFGFDTSAGRSVVIRLTEPPQSRWLAASRGASHRHLAAVIDVVDDPDGGVFPDAAALSKGTVAVVAEALRGESLAEHLRRERLGIDRSIAWVLRIAEAVRSLHARGAAHGALSAHSILVRARGRAIPPVVTQLLTPSLAAFASPERLTGEGPSLTDDLWAIGVLLHLLAMGELPFRGHDPERLLRSIQSGAPSGLASLPGPYMRELDSIVARFLAPQRRRRPSGIDDVIDALDRWERRSSLPAPAVPPSAERSLPSREPKLANWDALSFDVSDVPLNFEGALAALEEARAVGQSLMARGLEVASQSATQPGQLSGASALSVGQALSTTAAGGRQRMTSESFSLRLRSRPRWGVLALLVALIGAGAGAAAVSVFGSLSNTGRSIVKAVQTRTAPSRTQQNQRPQPRITPKKQQALCIRSYFPSEAFATDPDLEFACTNDDIVAVTQRLNTLAAAVSYDSVDAGPVDAGVSARPRPSASAELVVTPSIATRTWQLGWYELLATGIIQRNCCREPPPIKLPITGGFCPQLHVVVTNIANLSTKPGDISSAVRAFDEAITCLMSQGRHTVYNYKYAPTPPQKAAFQQFLTHAAEMDAKRASHRF